MTREQAMVELRRALAGLPPGTIEEKVGRAVERLAAREDGDELRALLVEVALGFILVELPPELARIPALVEAVATIAAGECQDIGSAESLAARALAPEKGRPWL